MKLALVAGGALACCVMMIAPARGQPSTPSPAARPAELFARTCAHCHNAAGWGTRALAERAGPKQAVLLERKTIPASMVKYVVRYGIGSMPQFTPTDLTDEELEQLAQWLERGR